MNTSWQISASTQELYPQRFSVFLKKLIFLYLSFHQTKTFIVLLLRIYESIYNSHNNHITQVICLVILLSLDTIYILFCYYNFEEIISIVYENRLKLVFTFSAKPCTFSISIKPTICCCNTVSVYSV